MSIRLKDGIVGNLSGNANTATTLQNTRNIKIGNATRSFNGSSDITWTLGDIGAAASNHSHNYAASNTAGGGALEVVPVQDTANKIYLAGVLDFNSAKIRASTPYLAGGTITATTFSGNLNGNATTATKLQNARSIKIGNTTRSFDGSSSISWTLSEIGAAAASHNHNYLTGVNSIAFASHETDVVSMGVLVDGTKSYMDFNLADDLDDMWRWRFMLSGSPTFNAMTLQALSGTTSRLTVAGEVVAPTFSGALSGNASTATKLQNAKTIKIGNTTRSFDGSSNVSWSLGDIGATTGVVANALVQRDVNSDISVRLVKATYMDQSTVTGALAFRVNNSSDNYVRFCSNPTAINNWLGLGSVPTHAPLITNLNSQLQSGWYSINTSTTGRPSGVDYGVVLQMRWYNGADFYQILVSSNNSRLYTRGYVNGGYTSWNEK